MESSGEGGVVLAILFSFLLAVLFIFLFIIFQKRKNKLIEKQIVDKQKFEKEIAEMQIEIREETLRNISWELHDNIGQLLTLSKIQVQNIETDTDKNEAALTIGNCLNELRALSKLINPDYIKNISLYDAIQLEIDRFNRLEFIKASLIIKGEAFSIESKIEIILFRILQEFFSNTIKHSKASQLDVSMSFKDQNLTILAKDNGIGFIKNSHQLGLGLDNMKKRAKLIQSDLIFNSIVDEGTSLKLIYRNKL